MEPLLGLASDQVDRFTLSGHNLEAYHCDEHKVEDMKLLMERLKAYNSDDEEANHVSINLFIGPRLLNTKAWQSLLWVTGLTKLPLMQKSQFCSKNAYVVLLGVLNKVPVREPS